jgi:hypothetical protein
MASRNTDEFDLFLLVKRRRNELLNMYELKLLNNIKDSRPNGSKPTFDPPENLLNASDREMLTHHVNLFLRDKKILWELLGLNEKCLNDVKDCLVVKRFLESFESILLHLVKNPAFDFKVNQLSIIC